MEVGEDVAVGRHDDARPERPLPERAWTTPPSRIELVAEEAPKEVVVRLLEVGRRHPRLALGANRDYGGRDHVDHVGVRVAASRDGVSDGSRNGCGAAGGSRLIGGQAVPRDPRDKQSRRRDADRSTAHSAAESEQLIHI